MLYNRICKPIYLLLPIIIISLTALQSVAVTQESGIRGDVSNGFDNPNIDDARGKLRQKMEKAALEDEHSFIAKLSRQIEIEKNKFVTNVKTALSQSEADVEVDLAKSEIRRFLEICKDLRVVGRYYVLDVNRVSNPDSPDREYIVDCRIDEPEIDWEERGKKTRNCTRRVEHSYFYVDEALAGKIKKSDVIIVQGQIEVIDDVSDGNDQLPYLMVVSLNFDVLSGRLTEAGLKKNRIAKLLIENYQVTLESEEEKRKKIQSKQSATNWKKQFVANAFAEKIEELFKARNDRLVNASTSSQRDDVIKSSNRLFQKYLSSCNSLTFSAKLIIKDVIKSGGSHVALCEIADDQPDGDIAFADTEFLTIRKYRFPVYVKESVARVAKPNDFLQATGIIEINRAESTPFESPSLGNQVKLPFFRVGENHVFLVLKDVVYESAKE